MLDADALLLGAEQSVGDTGQEIDKGGIADLLALQSGLGDGEFIGHEALQTKPRAASRQGKNVIGSRD